MAWQFVGDVAAKSQARVWEYKSDSGEKAYSVSFSPHGYYKRFNEQIDAVYTAEKLFPSRTAQ